MTRRSVSTSYYVQANDAVTGESCMRKIKKHTQIKFYLVEVLGYAGNSAWVFAGELMAFRSVHPGEKSRCRDDRERTPH